MIRIDDNTVFNPETGEFGYLPDIIQFEVDKTILKDETPAIVTWTVSNATKVLLNNEIVEPTGTMEFHSNELIEVILIAENDLGQINPRKLLIDIDRTPPIIHSFSIKEKFAVIGSPIKLEWIVEGHYSLFIDNRIGAVTDLTEKITTQGSNGVYKLIAKNYFGIETFAVASVTIFPTPIIQNIFLPIPELNTEVITSDQPSFNLSFEFSTTNITPNLNFVELHDMGYKLAFEKININSATNNLDSFTYLTKKQKEITYIVKSVWKREAKQILKRIKRQN